MNILHLTLKKRWYGLIESGVKLEEYREIKPYWNKRLLSKHYDAVRFRNGYRKDSPVFLIELKEILTGLGIVEWGAPNHPVYILKLGNVL